MITVEEHDRLLEEFLAQPGKLLQVSLIQQRKLRSNATILDLFDEHPLVDLREAICRTSLPNELFDLIVCNAVMEHVSRPWDAAREMARLLSPGGQVWVELPFAWPVHHEAYVSHANGSWDQSFREPDYWRFTPEGACELFSELTCVRCDFYRPRDASEEWLNGVVYVGRKESS